MIRKHTFIFVFKIYLNAISIVSILRFVLLILILQINSNFSMEFRVYEDQFKEFLKNVLQAPNRFTKIYLDEYAVEIE